MNQCPNCSSTTDIDASFCKYCAADLSKEIESVPITRTVANRRAFIVGGVVIAVLLIAGVAAVRLLIMVSPPRQVNSNSHSQRSATGNRAVSSQSSSTRSEVSSSSANEINGIAQKLQSLRVINCGDSYYRVVHISSGFLLEEFSFVQYGGVSTQITPYQLSDADKRNGCEWRGRISINAQSQRWSQNTIVKEFNSEAERQSWQKSGWKIDKTDLRMIRQMKEWEEGATLQWYEVVRKNGAWAVTQSDPYFPPGTIKDSYRNIQLDCASLSEIPN